MSLSKMSGIGDIQLKLGHDIQTKYSKNMQSFMNKEDSPSLMFDRGIYETTNMVKNLRSLDIMLQSLCK